MLGFAATVISNEEGTVVGEEHVLVVGCNDFVLLCCSSNNSLCNCLADCISLGDETTTGDLDADIELFKGLETEDEDWFGDLGLQGLVNNGFNSLTVDLEDTRTVQLAVCNCNCIFLYGVGLVGWLGSVVGDDDMGWLDMVVEIKAYLIAVVESVDVVGCGCGVRMGWGDGCDGKGGCGETGGVKMVHWSSAGKSP